MHMSKIPQTLQQIFTLVILASILGVTAQFMLPKGISLITEVTIMQVDSTEVSIPSVRIDPEGDLQASNISLGDAFQAHQAGSALFLDARDAEVFQAGHIAGAINLPVSAFMDSILYLEGLDMDQLIITYCDGSDCNASIDLASNLELMGFTRIKYFFGGWQEWQTAGYPVGATKE
jgi:3-mercaptopyruvate sulfurtransferase SseA